MEFIVLYILCILIIVLLFVLLLKPNKEKDEMRNIYSKIQTLNETQKISNDMMSDRLKEMNETIKGMNEISFQTNESIRKQLSETTSKLEEKVNSLTLQNESKLEAMRLTVENKITSLQEDNAKKLEAMRLTVDEKLQETLDKRISQSFQLVNDRLEQVYKGLGEMQTLANGVGDLKKVLSNVKTRGILGEIQLKAILEEILTPEQYEENVATKKGSSNVVEFALKLPGDGSGSTVYLPIDSKFPKEDFVRYSDAVAAGNEEATKTALKDLRARVLSEARDIKSKYIVPPKTTDFAILFVPTESLYAELLRMGDFAEMLQNEYKVVLTGPTNFSALINSLQIGFRTLQIEKNTEKIWKLFRDLKTQFSRFGEDLEKSQKAIGAASDKIDAAVKRSNAITGKLERIELPESDDVGMENNLISE